MSESEAWKLDPPVPTTFIAEADIESDGEVWAAVIVDAPDGWIFEVPGRRGEESKTIELTMMRRGG